jgi:hypothetical protein
VQSLEELKDYIVGLIAPLCLAIFGGAAKAASKGKRGWKGWAMFFADLFVAAFTGIVMFFILRGTGTSISPEMQAAFISLSGYLGPDLLKPLSEAVIRKAKSIFGYEEKGGPA